MIPVNRSKENKLQKKQVSVGTCTTACNSVYMLARINTVAAGHPLDLNSFSCVLAQIVWHPEDNFGKQKCGSKFQIVVPITCFMYTRIYLYVPFK